jgi:hypothetical protein
MSKTKTVFFGGTKGGVGKSLTSHLARISHRKTPSISPTCKWWY